MAGPTPGLSRTAYLVITHPNNGDVKDVLTITQSAIITTQQQYEFIFGTPETPLGGNIGTTDVIIPYTWNGPELTTSDFSVEAPSGAGNNSQIADVYSNGPANSYSVVVQMTSSNTNDGNVQNLSVNFNGSTSYFLTSNSITAREFSWTPCHVEGTVMYLADGSTKLVEDLLVGDVLKSYALDGLSTDENAWSTYNQTAGTFGATESTATVVSITPGQYTQYLNFNNGISKVTGEHLVVIKDADDNVSFKMARQAVVGDSFYTNGTWSVINSIETVNEVVNTYSIDTEAGDVYVADGILWHNAGPGTVKVQ
jgi:hypothetical protein